MPFIGTSNGVGYTITPYTAVTTGPSHQAAQFQSGQGTGQSQPITITFDRDVMNFVIEVVGPSFAGNFVVGYDVSGNEVARQESQFVPPGQPDSAFRVELQSPSNTPLRAVHLIPAAGDYVAYRNLYLYSTNTPYQAPPVTFTPGAGTSALDLSQFLQISTNAVTRQYVKNSMAPLTPDTIQLRNLSHDIGMKVTCRGASGVTFNPNTVTIPSQQTVNIEVDYDVSQLNQLSDGLNVINAMFDLTSDTPIFAPVPVPPVTPTAPPPIVVPTDVWLEQRYTGAPMGPLDQTPIDTIFGRSPFATSTISTINYGNGTLTAPVTIKWQGNWTFQSGNYQFSATADDGIRVWIDGNLLLDQWQMGAARSYTFTQNMSAGSHLIRVDYFNAYTDCAAIFAFNKVSDPTTFTPPTTTGGGGGGGATQSGGSGNLGGSIMQVNGNGVWVFNNDGFFSNPNIQNEQ